MGFGVCDIMTISDADCRLNIYNSSGDVIKIFDLADTKVDPINMPDSIIIYDGTFAVTVYLSQLPSINAGAFTVLQDLIDFIQPLIAACKCPCPLGIVGSLDQVLTVGNDGGGLQIKNIADPTLAQDAATKAYVDALVGSGITQVANYADLPAVGTVTGEFFWVSATTGGNAAGLYYSNGVTYEFQDILGKLLTGFSAASGTVSTSDSILSAINKIVGNIALKQDVLTDVNFGSFSNSLTAKTTPLDADLINIVDTADANKQKKVTFTNVKAFLKTYFDTIYQAILVSGTNIKTVNGNNLLGAGNVAVGDALVANPLSQFAATSSAQLAGVLSDETGTGVSVFNNAPTLINPVVGTQAPGDNSTKAASTAYADAAVAALSISSQILSAPSATVAASTTTYFFICGSAIGSTTEANRYSYMAKAGTFRNMYFYTVSSQPATGSLVVTLRINVADTAVTLTIAAGSAGGRFRDIANSVAYAADDRVDYKLVNNATTTSAQVNQTTIQS